jgi:hypothetical protein
MDLRRKEVGGHGDTDDPLHRDRYEGGRQGQSLWNAQAVV